jgi:shikimate dehydrogenase
MLNSSMQITGHTSLIAHIGYPTESFKAPMIYNPFFEAKGVDCVVVPFGCKADNFAALLPSLFKLTNIRGALITMPHKITVLGHLTTIRPAAAIAGACNAVRREADGNLTGDMFDGEGFVRGVEAKGRRIEGAEILIAGSGGVGSAIAASLAARGPRRLRLFDVSPAMAEALSKRLKAQYPKLDVSTGSNDPTGADIIVNATPLGMKPDDPLPFDVSRIAPTAFVGEVVMKQEMTPLLIAAQARGCGIQIGLDMLFEMIPAYLEFFGLPKASASELRALARISY